MLAKLLLALRDYFADTDDPTPGPALIGDTGTPQARNTERLRRIIARILVELAQNQRAIYQQQQQNTADIAAIKTKLGL